MKRFEVTFSDGTKQITKAPSFIPAVMGFETTVHNCVNTTCRIIKVEELDHKELKRNKQLMSQELSALGKKYLPKEQLIDTLEEIIGRYGFEHDVIMTGNEGQQNVPIGKETYLTYTWYKMNSENFEFVGYISL